MTWRRRFRISPPPGTGRCAGRCIRRGSAALFRRARLWRAASWESGDPRRILVRQLPGQRRDRAPLAVHAGRFGGVGGDRGDGGNQGHRPHELPGLPARLVAEDPGNPRRARLQLRDCAAADADDRADPLRALSPGAVGVRAARGGDRRGGGAELASRQPRHDQGRLAPHTGDGDAGDAGRGHPRSDHRDGSHSAARRAARCRRVRLERDLRDRLPDHGHRLDVLLPLAQGPARRPPRHRRHRRRHGRRFLAPPPRDRALGGRGRSRTPAGDLAPAGGARL